MEVTKAQIWYARVYMIKAVWNQGKIQEKIDKERNKTEKTEIDAQTYISTWPEKEMYKITATQNNES